MTKDTVEIALSMLDDIRIDCGQFSDVYEQCCNFFEALYYSDFNEYKKVLYNPIDKTHELK